MLLTETIEIIGIFNFLFLFVLFYHLWIHFAGDISSPENRIYLLLHDPDKELFDQLLKRNKSRSIKQSLQIYLVVNIALIVSFYLPGYSSIALSGIMKIVFIILLYPLILLSFIHLRRNYFVAKQVTWDEILTQNGIEIKEFETKETKFWELNSKKERLYILIRSFMHAKYPNQTCFHYIDSNGGNINLTSQIDSSRLNELFGTLIDDARLCGLITGDKPRLSADNFLFVFIFPLILDMIIFESNQFGLFSSLICLVILLHLPTKSLNQTYRKDKKELLSYVPPNFRKNELDSYKYLVNMIEERFPFIDLQNHLK